MAENQVGFSFQADVIGGSSLLHAATGRLLKALSDGGVDFYAVAAAVQLGKTIPISSSRELEITSLIGSRKGRAGFLTKVLSIGWGHSDVAIELARTRAGASALVTLGALATGSTLYVAAQAFTETLQLAGCEPDMLPTVDVVKPMIAYLSPFVSDGGFRRVLENITTTAKCRCRSAGEQPPPGLSTVGDVPAWARALHQLVFTASREEEVLLAVGQRGAWLSAFGSYILGMAVQLYLGDLLLWESAGNRGKAIVQVGVPSPAAPSIDKFLLVPPTQTKSGQSTLCVDYQLDEALQKELFLDPRINLGIAETIKHAIVRLLLALIPAIRMKTASTDSGTTHNLNGNFGLSVNTTIRVCTSLGLLERHVQFARASSSVRSKAWTGSVVQEHGLTYMDAKAAKDLRSTCGAHADSDSRSRIAQCLCCSIGGLIHAFAATATALLLCTYNPDELRVSAQVISGQVTTAWSRGLILDGSELSHGYVTGAQALVHLSHLLHGAEPLQDIDLKGHYSLLAVSAGSSTIYCKAILDAEPFDNEGRVLAIASGRLSMRGVLRKTVVESAPPYDALTYPGTASQWYTDAGQTTLAKRSLVVPQYLPGPMLIEMSVALSESEMIYQCSVRSRNRPTLPPIMVHIARCIQALMLAPVGKPCGHPRDRPYTVADDDNEIYIAPFFNNSISRYDAMYKTTRFFGLSGRPLEQLIQMPIPLAKVGRDRNVVYQGESCLACAEKRLAHHQERDVIMS